MSGFDLDQLAARFRRVWTATPPAATPAAPAPASAGAGRAAVADRGGPRPELTPGLQARVRAVYSNTVRRIGPGGAPGGGPPATGPSPVPPAQAARLAAGGASFPPSPPPAPLDDA